MGWSKLDEKFTQTTFNQSIAYFQNLYSMRRFFTIWWKQYIVSEHVRFIAEYTPGGLYFGRSLFRSTQEFAEPEDLNLTDWWIGFAVSRNATTGQFTLVTSFPLTPLAEFKALYKQNKGKGDW